MPLSQAQLDAFSNDGYLLIRGLLASDEAAALLSVARSDAALASDAYARKDATGGESKLALRNTVDDSPYSAVARSARVASAMGELLGDEVYHYHHKMMLKEPRVGGAWEWHQDYGYWYNFGCLFPDMGSCLIAVDRATRENGCLEVLRGSHRIGRVEHGVTGEQVGADPARVAAAKERFELVACEMDPGDALFFHANLLHASGKNESESPRWSLICCYNTKHNDPFITGGRHPNYTPLEIWPDDRVRETLLSAAAAVNETAT